MSTGSLIEQFRARVRAVERRQWVIGGLSVLMTSIIMVTFLIENRFGYLPRDPIITYFKSWDDARSRAEALADQEDEKRLAEEAEAIAEALDVGKADAAGPPAK